MSVKEFTVPVHDVPGQALIVVYFTRPADMEEINILAQNYRAGKIESDPDTELENALVNQLAYELQGAYDTSGMAGHFNVKSIELQKGVDYEALTKLRIQDDRAIAIRDNAALFYKVLSTNLLPDSLQNEIKQAMQKANTLYKGGERRTAPIGGINEHH